MKKVVSLVLTVMMLSLNVPGLAEDVQTDAFERLETESWWGSAELDQMTAERTYTNRFIVKYNDKKDEKLDKKEEKSDTNEEKIEILEETARNAFDGAKERKKSKRAEIESIKAKEAYAADIEGESVDAKKADALEVEERSDIKIRSVWMGENEYHVLTLNEAIEPNGFMENINEEIGNEIGYIQPDYKLQLSDVTEENNADTEQISNEIAQEKQTSDNETIICDIVVEETPNLDNATSLYDVDANLNAAHLKSSGEGVIIAVIDTGIDVTHLALVEHMISGYDFFNDNSVVYDAELGMEQAHGTHIAGIIAKVAPSAQIMPLKVFENGTAYTSDIIAAIQYAQENGANIVNCSWGSTDYNRALEEAIEQSRITFVCAAGNNRLSLEETPIYPASFDSEKIISVTSFNDDFGLSYFSNYGIQSVDLAAWGRNVYSSFPGGEYGEMSGTSMSAGYVSGTAALVAAQDVADIKTRLTITADKLSCLQTKVVGGNKINFNSAVNNIVNSSVIDLTPEDDFDVQGYQQTPTESWELFCSLENVQVSAGHAHTLVLKNNGSVWAWGNNSSGQLGNGTTTTQTAPAQVIGLTGISKICAGGSHSLALKNDGTIWLWGSNAYGQLGDGTTVDKTIPVQISGLTDVIGIAAGNDHSLAIKSGGTVWSWGSNMEQKLGDETVEYRTTPGQVDGLTGIIQVAGGYYHSMALKDDGTVWTWGYGGYGILGCGTNYDSAVPLQTLNLTDVTQIASGRYHNIAIQSGEVYAWGDNRCGQLGDGTLIEKYEPVKIDGISGIIGIGAGYDASVALKNDGTVWTWGNNRYGQLGDGTVTNRNTPAQIGLFGAAQISSGITHCVALKSDGTVWTWGNNNVGQLGEGIPLNRLTKGIRSIIPRI